jgi:pimeloyl-ACP methyl ester carboxylesterase
MATTSEGTVPFRGYRTWYRVAGQRPVTEGRLPMLVLHGGPGFPHDYLEADHPDDSALWTMATFVEEVAAVRDALGRPSGLASLVLASTCA